VPRSDVVGDIELDCAVFSVASTDLPIVAYTAATGSEAGRESTPGGAHQFRVGVLREEEPSQLRSRPTPSKRP
jgi:hypothetical protein